MEGRTLITFSLLLFPLEYLGVLTKCLQYNRIKCTNIMVLTHQEF